jgi:hypothetical protein
MNIQCKKKMNQNYQLLLLKAVQLLPTCEETNNCLDIIQTIINKMRLPSFNVNDRILAQVLQNNQQHIINHITQQKDKDIFDSVVSFGSFFIDLDNTEHFFESMK